MKMLQKAAKGTAVANAIGAVVKNPLLGLAGVAAAGVAGAVVANMITSNAEEGDDVLSKPKGGSGYGDRILLGPEGAISLNNKDTVIAGTDLFRGNDVISAGAGQVNVSSQGNKTGEKTNMLLEKLIGQNAKKPEISPVGLYEIA
jgi:hypothetical protein